MNVSYKDIVSRIRSLFKLISSDDILNDRVVLSEILATNIKLTVQTLQKRSGWISPNLFTTLECIEMEEVPLYSCCDTQSKCSIAKSVIELPRIVDCNYNLVLQGVWSLDKRYRYKEIGTPDRYADYLTMYPNPKEKFFWVKDNYLYVTDSNIEKVSLSAFFANPVDTLQFSCEGAPDCPVNPLDLEFKALPKLEDDIVITVYKKLLDTYKRSKEDSYENDSNEGQ